MHDYFDILGLSRDAPADVIRRASARRALRAHPDFAADDVPAPRPADRDRPSFRAYADVAVDFVDMAEIADRMRTAFFRTRAS